METFCVLSTSPRGTLDGLSIEAPRGAIPGHWTRGVGICEGGLRLQSCVISAPKESGGRAVVVDGPFSKPAIVGCQLSGGGDTVFWIRGARGLVVGCTISGARDAGLYLYGPSTAPLVASNAFRDSRRGIYIDGNPAWTA